MNGYLPILLTVLLRHAVSVTWRGLDFVRTRFLVFQWGMKAGRRVRFWGPTLISVERRGSIQIGDNVTFVSHAWWNRTGLSGPTTLTCSKMGSIRIGSDSGFSSIVIFSQNSVKIGRHAVFGGNVRIFDTNFHVLDPYERRSNDGLSRAKSAPVEIGDDVFVGTNAIILKGTRIGDRSIVAAGSVVFGLDVPPDSLVRGNPAVVVPRKNRKDAENG